MVLVALTIETVAAVVVAGGLAAWARKRFAPRPIQATQAS